MSELDVSILALLALAAVGTTVHATSRRPGVIAIVDTYLETLFPIGVAIVVGCIR